MTHHWCTIRFAPAGQPPVVRPVPRDEGRAGRRVRRDTQGGHRLLQLRTLPGLQPCRGPGDDMDVDVSADPSASPPPLLRLSSISSTIIPGVFDAWRAASEPLLTDIPPPPSPPPPSPPPPSPPMDVSPMSVEGEGGGKKRKGGEKDTSLTARSASAALGR